MCCNPGGRQGWGPLAFWETARPVPIPRDMPPWVKVCVVPVLHVDLRAQPRCGFTLEYPGVPQAPWSLCVRLNSFSQIPPNSWWILFPYSQPPSWMHGKTLNQPPSSTTSSGLLLKFSQPLFPFYPQPHLRSLVLDLRAGMKGSESGLWSQAGMSASPPTSCVNDCEKWRWETHHSVCCSDIESFFVYRRVPQTSLIPTPPTKSFGPPVPLFT